MSRYFIVTYSGAQKRKMRTRARSRGTLAGAKESKTGVLSPTPSLGPRSQSDLGHLRGSSHSSDSGDNHLAQGLHTVDLNSLNALNRAHSSASLADSVDSFASDDLANYDSGFASSPANATVLQSLGATLPRQKGSKIPVISKYLPDYLLSYGLSRY